MSEVLLILILQRTWGGALTHTDFPGAQTRGDAPHEDDRAQHTAQPRRQGLLARGARGGASPTLALSVVRIAGLTLRGLR